MIADLSIRQAVGIWSELEMARLGQNGFGGDTAEIYAYCLLSARDHLRGETLATAQQAGRNLHDLIVMFHESYDNVEVRVGVGRDHDGEPASVLLKMGFEHRIHVRVLHRQKKKETTTP